MFEFTEIYKNVLICLIKDTMYQIWEQNLNKRLVFAGCFDYRKREKSAIINKTKAFILINGNL